MSETNTGPERESWNRLKALPRDRPIQTLNLIKLKPTAEYSPDHPDHGKGFTGRQAHAAYGQKGAHILSASLVAASGRLPRR